MLYEAQFRNPAGAGKLIQAIRDMDLPELWIMEICGTHTMSIAKAGLRQILPPPHPSHFRPRLSGVRDPVRRHG